MIRLPRWLLTPLLRLTVRRTLARVQDPEVLRARFESRCRMLFRWPEGMQYTALHVPGARPVSGLEAVPWGMQPDRALLYLHGGAYVAGSSHTHAHIAGRLAEGLGARAVIPDYALAPEHRFPAALEDALACYRRLLEDLPPGRIAVAGDSAGGGLAAALLLLAEREGLAPPGCLALFSPWVDLRGTRPSIRENAARDSMLPASRLRDAAALYLGEADPADPLASPALATFTNPPPTLIYASEDEILRDDARALAERLRAAGGEVTLTLRPRLPHGWPVFAGRLREADKAVAETTAFLHTRLSG